MDPAGLTPDEAVAADETDPLGSFRGRFSIPDPSVSYLDGNSLGRPPLTAATAARQVLDDWAARLVGAWDDWIDRPLAIGELLGPLLGAAPGQLVIGESTTVALYQAVSAGLAGRPDRRVIVASRDDFPTDRYVVDGVAAAHGSTVRWTESMDRHDIASVLDDDVAVVVGSVANFETAAVVDVAAVTDATHAAGGLVVWDCSHAAGAIALDLDERGVDLAVGCTYKYLHGGPGSPAFTYVATRRQAELRQPIHGWFGQRDQFAMGPAYDPEPGIGAWRVGTPGILGLEVAAVGISIVAEAGIDAIRTKSLHLGAMMLASFDAWFADLGFTLGSPRDDTRRGGHVALRHPDASRIVRAARDVGVVADFRAPDVVRLGPGPLATSYVELLGGLERLRDVVAAGHHLRLPAAPGRVT